MVPDDQLDLFDQISKPAATGDDRSLDGLIDRHSKRAGVPRELLAALIFQESSGNPNAVNSESGATGLGQLMPATAKSLGVTNPLDPDQSIGGAADYLKIGLNTYNGDTEKALMRYYGGPNEKKWGERTRAYPAQVLRHIPQQPAAPADGPDPFDSISRPIDVKELDAISRPAAPPDPFKLQAGAPPPKEDEGTLLSGLADVGKDVYELTKKGVLGAAANVNTLARILPTGTIPGFNPSVDDAITKKLTGKTIGEHLDGWIEQTDASMSPEQRAANAKAWWDSDKGWFGDAWSDPRAYMGGVVTSIPETVLMMVPGGLLARTSFLAKRASVMGSEAVAGMGAKEAAEFATREAAKTAAATAGLSGQIIEGSLGGAQSYREVGETIRKMTPAQLESSNAYKALVASGMSPTEAQEKLSSDGATQAFWLGGIATGLFGGMGDKFLAKALAGSVSGGIVKRMFKGAAAEGALEEFPQSLFQQIGQNVAMMQAKPDQSLTEGALNQAFGGLVAGGIMGAGFGAAGKRGSEDSAAPGLATATPPGTPPPAAPGAAARAPVDETAPVPATDILGRIEPTGTVEVPPTAPGAPPAAPIAPAATIPPPAAPPPAQPGGKTAATPPPAAPAVPGYDDTGKNIPERPEDLQAQLAELVAGRRSAVMFPTGTPELPVPAGMSRLDTPRGTFHFNPAMIGANTITKNSAAGRENDILGLGPYSKADVLAKAAPGEKPFYIVERGAKGEELRGALAVKATEAATIKAFEANKNPNSTIGKENLGDMLARRQAAPAAAAPVVPAPKAPPAAPAPVPKVEKAPPVEKPPKAEKPKTDVADDADDEILEKTADGGVLTSQKLLAAAQERYAAQRLGDADHKKQIPTLQATKRFGKLWITTGNFRAGNRSGGRDASNVSALVPDGSISPEAAKKGGGGKSGENFYFGRRIKVGATFFQIGNEHQVWASREEKPGEEPADKPKNIVPKKTKAEYEADGAKAFAEGKPSIPPREIGGDIAGLNAWTKGWHGANAAAPVPGMPDLPSSKVPAVPAAPALPSVDKPVPAPGGPFYKNGFDAFNNGEDRTPPPPLPDDKSLDIQRAWLRGWDDAAAAAPAKPIAIGGITAKDLQARNLSGMFHVGAANSQLQPTTIDLLNGFFAQVDPAIVDIAHNDKHPSLASVLVETPNGLLEIGYWGPPGVPAGSASVKRAVFTDKSGNDIKGESGARSGDFDKAVGLVIADSGYKPTAAPAVDLLKPEKKPVPAKQLPREEWRAALDKAAASAAKEGLLDAAARIVDHIASGEKRGAFDADEIETAGYLTEEARKAAAALAPDVAPEKLAALAPDDLVALLDKAAPYSKLVKPIIAEMVARGNTNHMMLRVKGKLADLGRRFEKAGMWQRAIDQRRAAAGLNRGQTKKLRQYQVDRRKAEIDSIIGAPPFDASKVQFRSVSTNSRTDEALNERVTAVLRGQPDAYDAAPMATAGDRHMVQLPTGGAIIIYSNGAAELVRDDQGRLTDNITTESATRTLEKWLASITVEEDVDDEGNAPDDEPSFSDDPDFVTTFPDPRPQMEKLHEAGGLSMFEGIEDDELLDTVISVFQETGQEVFAKLNDLMAATAGVKSGIDPRTNKPFKNDAARKSVIDAAGMDAEGIEDTFAAVADEFGVAASDAWRAAITDLGPALQALQAMRSGLEVDAAAHQAATSPKNDKSPPTPAQKEAGNYEVGPVRIGGMDLSIENPEGSIRFGYNKEVWERNLNMVRQAFGTDHPLRVAMEAVAEALRVSDPIAAVKGLVAASPIAKQHAQDALAPELMRLAGALWHRKMKSHYGYIKGTVGKDKDHIDIFVKPGTPKDHKGPVFIIDQVNADGTFDEHKIMFGWTKRADAIKAYSANYSKGWKVGDVTKLTLRQFKTWLADGDTMAPLAPQAKKFQVAPVDNRSLGQANNAFLKRWFWKEGIQIKEIRDITGEKREKHTGAMVGTFRKNGRGVDVWGRHLVEDGWLAPMSESEEGNENIDADINDVRDFMRKVFDGEPILSIEEALQQDEDDAAADFYDKESKIVGLPPADIEGLVDLDMPAENNEEGFDAALELVGLPDDVKERILETAAMQADSGQSYSEAVRALAAEERARIQDREGNRGAPGEDDAVPAAAPPAAPAKAPAPELTKERAREIALDVLREDGEVGPTLDAGWTPSGGYRGSTFGRINGVTRKITVENEAMTVKFKFDVDQLLAEIAAEKKAPQDDGAALTGADKESTEEIAQAFDDALLGPDDDEPVHHLFDPPAKNEVVRLADKVKVYNAKHGWMTVDEAKAKIAEWEAHAVAQGETRANAGKVVLSLFDLTGAWSAPWEQAGYDVWRFDIQNSNEGEEFRGETINTSDINQWSAELLNDYFGNFSGSGDIHAILAAVPCTDFAVSGARHFAAKDADGRTIESVKLVQMTLAAIEYLKPAVWAIENPVGRIEKLGGLPPWRLSFDPNHLGDPYTKKTLLWGRFNGDLPVAPVEPTEGSKMHSQYGGKSQATKNARSATPPGFAYAFFMANNAVDHPAMAIANKYDRLDRAGIEAAVAAGVTAEQISDAVDDHYYFDMDDEAANKAIAALIPSAAPAAAPALDLAPQTNAQALAAEKEKTPQDRYDEADAKFKAVNKLFEAAKLDFRAQKIGDDEFLAARRAFDEASAAFDAAEAELVKWLDANKPEPAGPKIRADQVDMFNTQHGLFDQPAAAPTPKPEVAAPAAPASAEMDALKAQLAEGIDELASIIGIKKNLTPEQEAKLIPVIAKLFRVAAKMGYIQFKEAARYVLDQIKQMAGANVAEAISIENLQAGYINIAKEVGGDKRAALAYDSKEQLEAEAPNVPDQHSNPNLERPGEVAAPGDGVGQAGVSPGPGRDGGTGEQGVPGTDSQRPGQASGIGVARPETAPAGEQGDFSPYAEPPGPASGTPGDLFGERGGDAGLDGTSPDDDAADAVAASATSAVELANRRAAQSAAQKTPVVLGDKSNIDATLPFLHEGQRDDVLFAEERFAKPDGYGVMFTNGTGTGKTASGLGIVKRFERLGKTNTLIVVPSDKIMSDWVAFGEHLKLNIRPLIDTKDAGRGITITTYANFGQNNALAHRKWDLVVHDEAHYLMQQADGNMTLALAALRGMTMHPGGAYSRARMLNAGLLDQMDAIQKALPKGLHFNEGEKYTPDVQRLVDQLKGLQKKWNDAVDAAKAEVEAAQGAARPRVVFLSATPFAYEKTIQYAEGYLFEYPKLPDGRGGYNSGGEYERFMMQHFGYRMRYNKLTEPGPEVDRGFMQRAFNGMLKKDRVLSGRMLDVTFDYDRRFIMAESELGLKIDEGLDWLFKQRGMSPVREIIQKKFDHLSRRYLLEAIKSQEVIPLIGAQLAAGRKVVVFHDFKKGGSFNPFDVSQYENSEAQVSVWDGNGYTTVALGEVVQDFMRQRPDLLELPLAGLPSPIDALSRAFPDLMLFNGDVPKAQRRKNVEDFQSDNSGKNLILVQSQSGKEGISLHDTTGKFPRVLFNLGLPTQPTTAIQQEGRIYRVGQASNAMFRYLNTGTNWERYAFADSIARRSSTAENLALGEQARALLDGFIDAYEESDAFPVGHEGEGTGGKERDKAANNTLTEWDRAIALYYAKGKRTKRNKSAEGIDYFPTPEPLGLKMVQWSDPRPGDAFLEPSAGDGAIARWFPELNARTVVEPSAELASRLKMVTDARLLQERFEDLHTGANKFDIIDMNPPFGTAGRMAIDHLAKAAQHLNDGGRIAALIPRGSTDAKFDKWLYEEEKRQTKPLLVHPTLGTIYRGDTVSSVLLRDGKGVVTGGADTTIMVKGPGGSKTALATNTLTGVEPTGPRTEIYKPAKDLYLVGEIMLPTVLFERAGTSVASRIVIIEKQTNPHIVERLGQRTVDLSDATTIKDFFERLRDVEMPPRAQPFPVVPEAPAASVAATPDTPAPPRQPTKAPAAITTTQKEGEEVITHVTAKGKTLRGIVRTGISKEEAQQLDPYTFKKNGGWFIRTKHLGPEPLSAQPFQPGLSQRVPTGGAALSRERVAAIVDAVAAKVKFPIVVLEGSPKKLHSDLSEGAPGAYWNGKVYVFRRNIVSTADLYRVLAHELVGHASIIEMLGDEYEQIVKEIQNAKQLGNKAIVRLAQHVRETHGVLEGPRGAFVEASEIIARATEEAVDAEGNIKVGYAWLKRILSVVAQWLRSKGITVPFTEAELAGLISRAAIRVESVADARAEAYDQGYGQPQTASSEYRAEASRRRGLPDNPQADLFSPESLRKAAADFHPTPALPGKYLVDVKPVKVGEVRLGLKTIQTHQDAAHAFAALRRETREYFAAIVTDKAGKPLAYLDLFRGDISQTSVYPGIFARAVYATPGAARVWIAHNHPSGVPEPSRADRLLTEALNQSLGADVGIEMGGHVIIAGNDVAQMDSHGDTNGPPFKIPPLPRKFSVPMTELRMMWKKGKFKVSGPMDAPAAAAGIGANEDGILLLDAQHYIVGFYPLSVADMGKLRTGNTATGFGALMQAVARSGARAAIVYWPNQDPIAYPKNPLQNIANALGNGGRDIEVLDALVGKTPKSLAELGVPPTKRGDTFSAAPAPLWYSVLTRGVAGAPLNKATAAQWQGTINNLKGVKPEELRWSGIEPWLASHQGPITKQQILDYLNANNVQVEERLYGGDSNKFNKAVDVLRAYGFEIESDDHFGVTLTRDGQEVDRSTLTPRQLIALMILDDGMDADAPLTHGSAKFTDPTLRLPGGENYREIVLTVPPGPPSPEGLQLRKAAFDEYAPRIEEAHRRLMAVRVTPDVDSRLRGERVMDAIRSLEKRRDDAANAAYTLPADRPRYEGGHYPGGNNVVHIRFDERTDEQGRRVLHLAEVQSDWAQTGRREGFGSQGQADIKALTDEYKVWMRVEGLDLGSADDHLHDPKLTPAQRAWLVDFSERWDNAEQKSRRGGTPEGPYVQSTPAWSMLAMRRMIRYAAEHGFEALTWDVGETQNDRYNLSKRFTTVSYQKKANGNYRIKAWARGETGGFDVADNVAPDRLAGTVGKDLADLILDDRGTESVSRGQSDNLRFLVVENGWKNLEGVQLEIKGKGMIGFYDQILVSEVNKFVKQWGAKVEQARVMTKRYSVGFNYETMEYFLRGDGPSDVPPERYHTAAEAEDARAELNERGAPAHSLPITDAMRTSAMQGMPLFSQGLNRYGAYITALEKRVDRAYRRGRPEAEDLDARLTDAKERFEDDGTAEPGEESFDYVLGDQATGLESGLAENYERWRDGTYYGTTPEDAIATMRANIQESGGKPGTDAEVLAAAKDAFEAREARRNRLRARRGILENLKGGNTDIAQIGYEKAPVPRVQASRRLEKLFAELDAGKMTPEEFTARVRWLSHKMADVAAIKSTNSMIDQRVRGASIVREKLLRAGRAGEIDQETLDFTMWALDQNPAIADGLAFSLYTPKGNNPSIGDYNPAYQIMRVAKGHGQPVTAVHEILHHTERMMPPDMQAAIREEWIAALTKAITTATPEVRDALANVAKALAGDSKAYRALAKAITEGPLNYDDHYQLVNPSEYWAVNATRLMAARFAAQGSVWQRVKVWMRELVQRLRGLLGLPSDAPIIKALNYVIDPDNFDPTRGGRFLSPTMLTSELSMRATGGAAQNLRAVTTTAAFKKWFGASKVVDANGDPRVVYHGTPDGGFEVFDGYELAGWFSEEADLAAHHGMVRSGSKASASVIPTYLSIKNPVDLTLPKGFDINLAAKPREIYAMAGLPLPADPPYPEWPDHKRSAYMHINSTQFRDDAEAAGYDGVKVRQSGIVTWGAFKPEQIKSAIGNNGNFDPAKKSILAAGRSIPRDTGTRTTLLDLISRKAGGELVRDYITQPLWRRIVALGSRVIPERIKVGLAGYDLPEPYVDAKHDRAAAINGLMRETKNVIDSILYLDRNQSRVAYQWMTEFPSLDTENALLEELPEDARAVMREMKAQISSLGRSAVDLGLLSQEVYDRNNLAYLHRSYMKYEKGLKAIERAKRTRAIALRGENFRKRGLRDDATMDQIFQDEDIRRRAGKGDTDLKGRLFLRLERRTQPTGTGTLEGIPGESLGRLRAVAYVPAGAPIPERFSGWRVDGVWEARFFNVKDKVGMWRDFNADERQRMGEIDEVRYAYAKTMLNMVADVETARFLKRAAELESRLTPAQVTEMGGIVVDRVSDSKTTWQTFKANEWVQVPDTKVFGTDLKKFGALAGRYIPGNIWNDIRSTVNLRAQTEAGEIWDKIMITWKLSKTALSPAVHMNNVMSNFILADLADVRARDIARALRVMWQYKHDDPAVKEIMHRYQDSGAELGSMLHVDLRQDVIEPLLEQLEQFEQAAADDIGALLHVTQIMSLVLHGNLVQAYHQTMLTRAGKMAKILPKAMLDLYGAEDMVFRLASFLKSVDEGKTDRQAGDIARKAFLDYQIDAPWIQAMRRSALPFVAFSYRAIPILINGFVKTPWKMLKYGMVGGGLNALGYALMGLGGDDEDRERRLLPEQLQGKALGFFPRMIRMPWNDQYDSPVFLDVRRWIPGGDIVDLEQSRGAISLPAWLGLGGPLAMVAEISLNKSLFTGQEISAKSGTMAEKTLQVVDYLYKFWMPNIPNPIDLVGLGIQQLTPAAPTGFMQTWSATKIGKAATGETDALGRDTSLAEAGLSAVGIKVSAYPEDELTLRAAAKLRGEEAEINRKMAGIRRQLARGGISRETAEERLQYQAENLRQRRLGLADKRSGAEND